MKSRPLDHAIARVEAQLRFLPTATIRRMRILALLNEATASACSVIHLHDSIGGYLGGVLWPLPAWRLLQMGSEVGAVVPALSPCSDLFEAKWDAHDNTAFTYPDSLWLSSPLYRYLYRELDLRYVATYGNPARADGSQVVVFATRSHADGAPYKEADLKKMAHVCTHFAAELSSLEPAGPYMPPPSMPADHVATLDADLLRPRQPLPRYVQALFAVFYGACPLGPDGQALLPPKLQADIRQHLADYQRTVAPTGAAFFHAFTKPHRGRVLCLSVESHPTGTFSLRLHEDLSQHRRLHRLNLACRALDRDRRAIFSACLVIAEGVHADDEIAHRAGFAALKPSSAVRLINQARRIVAASGADSPTSVAPR
jgi:hypothetical protein